MKKRMKISLRTKIYLTIGGLLGLTGILYASNPFPFSSGAPIYPGFPSAFFPTGVAAAPDLLLVTPFCSEDVLSIDCNGQAIVARLTRQSTHALDLRLGQDVFAVIKTVSFDRANTMHAIRFDS